MSTIRLIRGDDTDVMIRLQQDNAPYDMSQISRIDLHAKANGKPVIVLSTTDGSIEIGEQIVLHIDRAMTLGAMWKQAKYDLQLTIGTKVQTVLFGVIELVHDITEV